MILSTRTGACAFGTPQDGLPFRDIVCAGFGRQRGFARHALLRESIGHLDFEKRWPEAWRASAIVSP
jgi:hypothetical protein